MRAILRNIAVGILALAASACTSKVQLAPISVAGSGLPPIAGSYRVVVQQGGWQIKAERKGMTCWQHSFDIDIDAIYAPAMREAVTQTIRTVDFQDAPLPVTELKAAGYDGQIVIQQTNAAAVFAMIPGFFTATADVEVGLTTIIALIDDTGLRQQRTTEGKARRHSDIYVHCGEAEEAMKTASTAAITDLVRKNADTLREVIPAKP